MSHVLDVSCLDCSFALLTERKANLNEMQFVTALENVTSGTALSGFRKTSLILLYGRVCNIVCIGFSCLRGFIRASSLTRRFGQIVL